ncbi:D-alanine--D-alanine ligase [Natronosporangium hydrolyticum]|uniref:D-alanine--D-alanine ligase n=1 Tax=Natronosporangium hydrolyticum TaxID=2811111 RepID=A0A895YIP3_9ACTN|nr:D-alanine--D-alanine ligase [Natronosporangium hydrolyticum]
MALVFGGRSAEHAISCLTAGSVLNAIDPDEFEVVPIGITRAGQWVLTTGERSQLELQGRTLPEVTEAAGSPVMLPPDPTARGRLVLAATDAVSALGEVDLVFPVLHGAYGEDGTIQGLLEMAGVPYVGSGVFASAAAMDKEFSKQLAVAAGIPVGPYAVLRAGASLPATERERLGLPVFVKPSRAGSSFGITKVTDWAQFDDALAVAREVDSKVLVEAAVVGREIECGVLAGEQGGEPEASQLAEVRPAAGHEFYDFEAKYLDDSLEMEIPAPLPERVTAQLQRYATTIFTALDCAGLARVDFFVTAELDVYFNELNTMPGFTPSSVFPRVWAASGLPYPKLVARLIRTALAR